jgi:choline dehydrogenase
MTTPKFSALKSNFESGKISRRKFLRSSAALGVVAATPMVLSGQHASAQAAESYDYVVVGAGSAGCAIAARLCEDPSKTVLVLEAGPPDDNQYIHIPATFPFLFNTELDWAYSSTPQKGLNERNLFMPRGKMYGGTSSINAMIYQRGHPSNYNSWGKDNPGWDWDAVMPFFMKAEDNSRGASEMHGAGGPLNVSDLNDPNPLTLAFVEAAKEQGHKINSDFNDGDQEGFGQYQVTQNNGKRESTAVAYLHPALENENLTIQGEALAHKLLISDGKCTGVRFEAGGEIHEVNANLEVIVSAGAFNSPQLLMLSGIGPKADLEALGITVEKDLPGVGQNLQDHGMAPLAYHSLKPVTLAGATEPGQAELFAEGMGLLTSNIGEAGGFLTVFDDVEAPDLQFHFAPNWFIADGAGNPEGHGYTLLPGIVGTRSVGSLSLVSADAHDKPVINPAVLEDDRDLEVVLEGFKIGRKLMESSAFDEFRGEEYLPGKDVQTDDELREFIRNNIQTIYHPVGTCKMGSDDMAVVDAQLRVHGIGSLRVADASIMPFIVNCNTNAPSIMIGEKCADLVKADA